MTTLLEKHSVKKGSYASLLKKIIKEPNAKELCAQAIEEMKVTYVAQPDLLEHMIAMYDNELKNLPKNPPLNGNGKTHKSQKIVLEAKVEREEKDDIEAQLDFFKKAELHKDLIPYFTNEGKFPMLRHPLVYSVPHHEPLNDFINQQYEHKKKAVSDAKTSANYSSFVFLHERPHRLNAFSEICEWLNDTDYYELLALIWRDSENISQQRELWQKLLMGRVVVKRHFMSIEDRKVFDSLPKEIKVYRGYVAAHKNRNGFSYTLDKSKAEWFAKRFHSKGKVCAFKITKDKVFAYTNERGEQEVIILPTHKITKR